jgi:hypothetical protein
MIYERTDSGVSREITCFVTYVRHVPTASLLIWNIYLVLNSSVYLILKNHTHPHLREPVGLRSVAANTT